MIFAWRHQAHTPAKGRVAWNSHLAKLSKFWRCWCYWWWRGGFKGGILAADRYVGFGAGGQILAPAVINNKG